MLDKGLIVGVLVIDFRKALDTINHKILEKKLQGFGIAGQMFDILCDYLKNRTQYVELNGVKQEYMGYHRVHFLGLDSSLSISMTCQTIQIKDTYFYLLTIQHFIM